MLLHVRQGVHHCRDNVRQDEGVRIRMMQHVRAPAAKLFLADLNVRVVADGFFRNLVGEQA